MVLGYHLHHIIVAIHHLHTHLIASFTSDDQQTVPIPPHIIPSAPTHPQLTDPHPDSHKSRIFCLSLKSLLLPQILITHILIRHNNQIIRAIRINLDLAELAC